MSIDDAVILILKDYPDKDEEWAYEQLMRAWNNTDSEVSVEDILRYGFDILIE